MMSSFAFKLLSLVSIYDLYIVNASNAITITPPNNKMYSAAPCPEFSFMSVFIFFIFSPVTIMVFLIILILLFFKKVLQIFFFALYFPIFSIRFINGVVDKILLVKYRVIKRDKGENVGNTLKLVSGFILFVIGVLIAYETAVYNLVDILFIVGFIITIVGIILIVSYFVDSNADRTTNAIKDFITSNEFNSSSLNRFEKKSDNLKQPLHVRREFNEYDDSDYGELVLEDYEGSSSEGHYGGSLENNPKAVLNVVRAEERDDAALDRPLHFTPRYDKPLKVTRAPKRREEDYFTSDVPEFIVETDKSDEIKKALSQESPAEEIVVEHQEPAAPEFNQPRDIKIDINDPESLPVPKSLQSYVIYDEGMVSSQDAFDKLAVNVNKEIMLEIPSLNDLSDRFLSHVPTIYSRVIIDEFDVSDMSYMFLISSLLKQGVHIRTVPKVHTVNLITDDSHAMIISDGPNGVEYGAIYDDRKSISDIRSDFEKTWDIASVLDESIVMGAGGSA